MKTLIKVTYVFEKKDRRSFTSQCKKLNLTQVQIAKKLKITTVYLNYILSGNRPIGEELMKQLEDLGFSFKGE